MAVGTKREITNAVWKSDSKYSRSNYVKQCDKCKDTAFELLIDNKKTGRCCRCGDKFT